VAGGRGEAPRDHHRLIHALAADHDLTLDLDVSPHLLVIVADPDEDGETLALLEVVDLGGGGAEARHAEPLEVDLRELGGDRPLSRVLDDELGRDIALRRHGLGVGEVDHAEFERAGADRELATATGAEQQERRRTEPGEEPAGEGRGAIGGGEAGVWSGAHRPWHNQAIPRAP
jgi:hypothetical protein